MNFLLKNLEMSLTESHLLMGEKLIDGGKVTALYENERNLWIAKVDGFETEMQISPSRVRACSCECKAFLTERMCGHIAAGLLRLRSHLSEKKVKKTSPPENRYRKLTVNAILEEVEQEELRAFIRNYARRDRNFSIALKTRFAGVVPMKDSRDKYRQILESVIRSSRKKNNRISVIGSRQINAILTDLLGQSSDFIALEQYAESWPLLQVVFEKIMPLVNKVDTESSPFEDPLSKVFDQLGSMLEKNLSPDLRSEIRAFFQDECTKPVCRNQEFANRIYDLLLPLADEQTHMRQLLETGLSEWEKRHMLSSAHREKILEVLMQLFRHEAFGKEADAFFQSLTTEPNELLRAIENAIREGRTSLAEKLAVSGLSSCDSRYYGIRFNDALLAIAIQEDDNERIVKVGTHCYLLTLDLKYFKTCRAFYKEDWDRYVDELSVKLDERGDQEALAEIWLEENRFADFAELVRKNRSLDFMMRFDHHFLPDRQQDLYELYVPLLDEYLSSHLGIKPTQKILGLFHHLRKAGADKLVEDLVAFVRERYPRRMELAMELLSL